MNKSKDKLKNRAEIYKSLVSTAPYVPGDLSPPVPIQDIPWVDDSLIKHGVAFYRTHLTQTLFASVLTFLLGLSVKSITVVLLKGQMGHPDKYFSRLISGWKITAEFFQMYMEPEKNEVYKKYTYVRKQHSLARKRNDKPTTNQTRLPENNLNSESWKDQLANAVRSDLGYIDTASAPSDLLTWKPPLAVSQLDMVLVQFMSIWMFWGFPKLFGIRNRKEELKGVVHLWAIYGRMIGIKDEFNVCLKPDYELYDLLTRNFLIESLKRMNATVVTVQHALMEDLGKRIPFMTYRALLYIGLRELQGCEGESLSKIMSIWDKSSVYFLQGWMWLARQNFVCRFLLDIPTGMWLLFHYRKDVWAVIQKYYVIWKNRISEKVSNMLEFLPKSSFNKK